MRHLTTIPLTNTFHILRKSVSIFYNYMYFSTMLLISGSRNVWPNQYQHSVHRCTDAPSFLASCLLLLHNCGYYYYFLEKKLFKISSKDLASWLPFCNTIEYLSEQLHRYHHLRFLLFIMVRCGTWNWPKGLTVVQNCEIFLTCHQPDIWLLSELN